MNELISIQNKDNQLVVSSREVASHFERRHDNVIRDIENLIKEDSSILSIPLMIGSQYQHEQNKQWYKEYLLTRDGFSLLVMGFTGSKALQWKLKYIEAFNEMEQSLKQSNIQGLSPQLQLLINMELEQKRMQEQLNNVAHKALKASHEAEEAKSEIKGIREVMTLSHNAWRAETTALINKIAQALGGFEHIKHVREESYKLLDERAGAKLSIRQTNMKRKVLEETGSKSKAEKITKIDVIAADKRLTEVYIAIVKEMAIKYKAA